MKISCENTYSDGRESTVIHEVDDATIPADLDDMWDELWCYTGDGTGESLDAIYEITIVESADPKLVGLTRQYG
jgi:hypothetical protein